MDILQTLWMEGNLSYFHNLGGGISRLLPFGNKNSIICLMDVEILLLKKSLSLLKLKIQELQKRKKERKTLQKYN